MSDRSGLHIPYSLVVCVLGGRSWQGAETGHSALCRAGQ